MKVYVLVKNRNGGCWIEGVYGSEARAKARLSDILEAEGSSSNYDWDICEESVED